MHRKRDPAVDLGKFAIGFGNGTQRPSAEARATSGSRLEALTGSREHAEDLTRLGPAGEVRETHTEWDRAICSPSGRTEMQAAI
jgi:hypothetical protein